MIGIFIQHTRRNAKHPELGSPKARGVHKNNSLTGSLSARPQHRKFYQESSNPKRLTRPVSGSGIGVRRAEGMDGGDVTRSNDGPNRPLVLRVTPRHARNSTHVHRLAALVCSRADQPLPRFMSGVSQKLFQENLWRGPRRALCRLPYDELVSEDLILAFFSCLFT